MQFSIGVRPRQEHLIRKLAPTPKQKLVSGPLWQAPIILSFTYPWRMIYHINTQQKQSPRGVPRKRCSENMQQIYRRTPMPKCDFNKVDEQLYLGCSTSLYVVIWVVFGAVICNWDKIVPYTSRVVLKHLLLFSNKIPNPKNKRFLGIDLINTF